MITFEEAKRIVMESAVSLPSERVPLARSAGRVLAEDALSDVDMPPFNKSAMDGYACRRADLEKSLRVVEEIPAGHIPQKSVGPGECSKIMTGAMVPEGADCVIMVEYTEEVVPGTIRFTGAGTRDNICLKGEDVRQGDVVLRRGVLIKPQHVAVLAALGYAEVPVSIRPRVGIIATGSELVEPTEKAVGAKIRNSNGWQLAAQAEATGCEALNYGIVPDTEEAIDSALKRAIRENDVVILSGGVSMGDLDLVPGVLRKNGVEILFDRVAIQPGNPSTFGVAGDVRFFGLPGNPVSTFLQFELLLKPFLYRMMGYDFAPPVVPAELLEDVKRRKAVRASLLPVRFAAPGKIVPVEYHGSAHITAMCRAEGVIVIPIGETAVPKGTVVDVRLLP